MTLLLAIACMICAWAVLRVFADERQRRVESLRRILAEEQAALARARSKPRPAGDVIPIEE